MKALLELAQYEASSLEDTRKNRKSKVP